MQRYWAVTVTRNTVRFVPLGKGVLRRRLLEAAGFLNDGCASVWIIFYFHL